VLYIVKKIKVLIAPVLKGRYKKWR